MMNDGDVWLLAPWRSKTPATSLSVRDHGSNLNFWKDKLLTNHLTHFVSFAYMVYLVTVVDQKSLYIAPYSLGQ